MSLLSKINRACFALAIFTLPFQINYLIYQTIWGRGFTNPYTSIWLSLSEILILLASILMFIDFKKLKKKIDFGEKEFHIIILSIQATILLSLLLSPFKDHLFSFLLSIKVFTLFLLYLLVTNKVLKMRDILEVFIVSMSLQALLAIFQFTFQSSFGLHFLGEPFISSITANLARIDIGTLTMIRAYGTFPHPNILAGFLSISLLLTLLSYPKVKNEREILFAIQFLGLLVTFSRVSLFVFLLAIGILAVWYLENLEKIFVSKRRKLLLYAFISIVVVSPLAYLWVERSADILIDGAFTERINGIIYAFDMFIRHPMGVGYSHFTLFLDSAAKVSLLPWQYQPVHNIFILALAETGLLGLSSILILTIFSFKKLLLKRKKLLSRKQRFKKRVFLVICLTLLLISLFDHYLWTLDQGRQLVIILFGIFAVFSQNPRDILPIKKGGKFGRILADQ